MEYLNEFLNNLGIDPKEEVSEKLRGVGYPQDFNPILSFSRKIDDRGGFIDRLIQERLLGKDMKSFNAAEIGGGLCSTGAAFAKKCKNVLSFELEKTHCLYADRCKKHFGMNNLAILQGSIISVDGQKCYSIKNNSLDLVISYMGMYRYTVLESLEIIHNILKPDGKFIFVYPRFWSDETELNDIDNALLSRAQENNENWKEFRVELSKKLNDLNFAVEYSGILENYKETAIGGDIIVGSNIAKSPAEYFRNPIKGISFGKTLISCNTMVCIKSTSEVQNMEA